MQIKWGSKTVWVSIVTMLLSFSPMVDELVKNNPSLTLKILAGIMVFLRLLTNGPLITKSKGDL
jgi:hypothetical protein